jgi:integrase
MPQYQRKVIQGIRWWYKFSYGGLTYHSKAIYLTKNEAKRAENDRYKEVEQQAQNPSKKPILSLMEAINERLDYIEVKKSKKYYTGTKRYLNVLFEQFGDVPIDTIKKADIEKLLLETSKKLQEEGKDNYAVNGMISCYKALFNFVIDSYEDIDLKNPVLKIDMYSVEKHVKYIPSDKDIEAVLAQCTPEQKRLLQFIDSTAARINECLNLKGKDITGTHVILYTRKSRNSDRVPRKLPLPDCLNGMTFKDEERVFGYWSDMPKFLERKIKQLKQRPWGFHNLRHRRASIWSKEGRPLFEIMSLLGHSSLKTTQLYLQML